MNSITDYLISIEQLTQKNLDILQAINDSFLTKQEHLVVNIGESKYIIPSYIALENKINALQEGLNNLIHAPETGEAFFNFDGNSRAIEVRKYNHAPSPVSLNTVTEFNIENNNIFKDFLTPIPSVRFNLSTVSDDNTTMNVKKVIPKSQELIDYFKSKIRVEVSSKLTYSELYKKLILYKKDIDYIEYDTIKTLPIRKNLGSGMYVIKEIIDDRIDDNLDEFITIRFRNDLSSPLYMNNLSYKLFDDTIEKPLSVGDRLVTYDSSAKMEIIDINTNSNTMTIKILNGEFLNLVPDNSKDDNNISSLSILKFFSYKDLSADKYLDIPLEEDQYIYIAIAPLNGRMNIQASWGEGVVINTFELTNNSTKFQTYYNENVRNIGDILYEITSMLSNTLTKYSREQFDKINTIKPVINPKDLLVVHINKHLNDTEVFKNIRSLYAQKKKYNTELNEVQLKIDEINSQLAKISFDDTSNLRSVYTAQLTEYNSKRNEVMSSITKIIDEISTSVKDSEVPLENAKYRIRGYFDYEQFIKDNKELEFARGHIKGIKVYYRYKTVGQDGGNAISINQNFIFSDWNIMGSFDNPVIPTYTDSGYKSVYYEDEGKNNEPHFNQIDIPISQGETVDMKLKVIYDFGAPFVETGSDWSDIINIEFPQEYIKNVEILDIISENNDDIETNRFTNILQEQGVPSHIDDKIVDQDITYYHRPENISSGFYTSERRIIPLKDKLSTIDSDITLLKDEIYGTTSDQLTVSIVNGDVTNVLYPYQSNNIGVTSYDILNKNGVVGTVNDGVYTINDKGTVSTVLNIVITNNSTHTIKLYPMFPGSRDVEIASLKNYKYNREDFCVLDKDNDKGVYIVNQYPSQESHLQTANQYITFRMNNISNDESFYKEFETLDDYKSNFLSSNKDYVMLKDNFGAALYPYIRERNMLCYDSDNIYSVITIGTGEEYVIPLIFEYNFDGKNIDIIYSKTMSFNLRTSLFQDPLTYMFTVTAKYMSTIQDKIITTNRRVSDNSKYHTTVVK